MQEINSNSLTPQIDRGIGADPGCNPACQVCHYKDISYSAQLQKKTNWAETQLENWKEVLHPIIPAPEGERIAYRSKSWLRAHLSEKGLSFGKFRSVKIQGQWEKEFISWDSCPLHIKSIQGILPKIRKTLQIHLPRFVEKDLVGLWLASPHLVLVSRSPVSTKLKEEIKALDWISILRPPFSLPFSEVSIHCNRQAGKKAFGHSPIERIKTVHEGKEIEGTVPIKAFRQTAQTLLIQARKEAVNALLRNQPQMVFDLYCGTGELSLLLPPELGWIGIELNKEAVAYANQLRGQIVGTKIHANHTVQRAFVGSVEARLQDPNVMKQVFTPYALFLNPPRSGLSSEAVQKIMELIQTRPPTSVAYLSCSASGLARDLRILQEARNPQAGKLEVQLLQPYDFFPQTEHFETLAVLEWANS